MTYRVFCEFGWSMVDGYRARSDNEAVSWEIEGRAHFEAIQESRSPTILLTTHTGSYDLAAYSFASKFGRRLNTVRLEERSESLKSVREKDLKGDCRQSEFLNVLYNSNESLLGVELVKLLQAGEIVALQADRVIESVSPISITPPDCEAPIRLPKGPLTLAAVTKADCYPLFVIRSGYRHYTIHFLPPLQLQQEGRRLKELDYAQVWADTLWPFLREHSTSWMVFEPCRAEQI